ncbi:hypothetical protein ADN00_15780 [Ornatilinea apprima]|uniref:Uncharacterized protein n=1 Tax=Ornatilinea apprima TaxID=1134406 RepID=A0A0P6WQE4_9CHLR|nr:hypothetical protein [Ornatilinea apprima]KPL72273.1 hypothetical protein ADN00_15780 [Ornatilinea apprima]
MKTCEYRVGFIATKPESAYNEVDVTKTKFVLDLSGKNKNADVYQSDIVVPEKKYDLVDMYLEIIIPGHPKAEVVRENLQSPEIMALLPRIFKGHSFNFGGGRYNSILNQDAQNAVNELVKELESIPDYYTPWTVEKWMEKVEVTSQASDELLERIAHDCLDEFAMMGDSHVLLGNGNDLLIHLKKKRTKAREILTQ